MKQYYVAEVGSPYGGSTLTVRRDYLAELDDAIDRALGIACDRYGREIGALSQEEAEKALAAVQSWL